MSSLEISIRAFWQKEQTDLGNCACCAETIYSNQNRLAFVCGGRFTETEVVICNSCYEIISHERCKKNETGDEPCY